MLLDNLVQERRESLIEALGLTVKVSSDIADIAKDATATTALARPSKAAQMRRITAAVVDLSALTVFSGRDRKTGKSLSRQERVGHMMERVVMNPRYPGVPLIKPVSFVLKNKGGGKLLCAELTLPDPDDPKRNIDVVGVPHFIVDGIGGVIDYVDVVRSEVGGQVLRTEQSKSMYCVVLRPEGNNEYYRLLPLGLAPRVIVDFWNQIALEFQARGESERDWPTVEHIPHNIDGSEGTRFLKLKPDGLEPVMRPKKKGGHIVRDNKGQVVMEESNEDTYGYLFGMRMIADGTHAPPDAVNEEGVPVYTRKHVFLVNMNEWQIRLNWLGREGEVRIKQGVVNPDGDYSVDGFAAFGLDVASTNPRDLNRLSSAMVNGRLDKSNPLYVHALSTGEAHDGDREESVRALLLDIANRACDYISSELKLIRTETVDKVLRWSAPSLAHVLAQDSVEDVWNRRSGDDALASWLNERIEGDFNWDSWLHRCIRQDVLRKLLVPEGREGEIPKPGRRGRNVTVSPAETAPSVETVHPVDSTSTDDGPPPAETAPPADNT